jgi:outer membrane lipoprotein SlyB
LVAVSVATLSGCGPDYSPNTYAAVAVQQANKVEQGVIVGVRAVGVSAPGVVGTATGAAAGGIVGSQTPGDVGSAFGGLGGALVGGLVGSAVEHTTSDSTAYEYIVRKPNGDLLSVTQQDTAALTVGQKVLLIDGKQARIVPDYTVALPSTISAGSSPGKDAPAPVSVTSTVPPAARVDSTPLAPPTATQGTGARGAGGPTDLAASPDAPSLASPVPPPPLTPGAPLPLAPSNP